MSVAIAGRGQLGDRGFGAVRGTERLEVAHDVHVAADHHGMIDGGGLVDDLAHLPTPIQVAGGGLTPQTPRLEMHRIHP